MPRIRNSVASAPRSSVPSTSGSGGSSPSGVRLRAFLGPASLPPAGAGANSRSTASVDLAFDRLKRHHAGLPDAGADLRRSPARRRPAGSDRIRPKARGNSRNAGELGELAARRPAGASIAKCRPVSGMSSTATGTLQGLPVFFITIRLLTWWLLGYAPGPESAARRRPGARAGCAREITYRLPHIGRKAGRRRPRPAPP